MKSASPTGSKKNIRKGPVSPALFHCSNLPNQKKGPVLAGRVVGTAGPSPDVVNQLALDLRRRHGLDGKHVVEIACGQGDFLKLVCAGAGSVGTGFDPSFRGGEPGALGVRMQQQQAENARRSAELTAHIRKREPQDITVSVGAEIGEVGEKNSTVEELDAYVLNYKKALAALGDYAGLSKISVQTGTSHGGVVLPDGTLAQVLSLIHI